MQSVHLVVSDWKGEQWGRWTAEFPTVPRAGEIIHFHSEESGNAVFHVAFVQYNYGWKVESPVPNLPYIHVDICDDDEPFLTGHLRGLAESLKRAGIELYKRDTRGW